MSPNICLIISLFACFLTIHTQIRISPSLPDKLSICYRQNFSDTIPKVPHNIQVLIELIRKLEHDSTNALNMRMLTTAIFYAARLDGIEESENGVETEIVIPFKATGKQFHKFRLIAEHFLSGNDERFSYDAISQQELCILHSFISSTLNSWERGNERHTCEGKSSNQMYGRVTERKVEDRELLDSSDADGKVVNDRLVDGRLLEGRAFVNVSHRLQSACPVEKGVVKTRWGTISPGHIISAFVASFEESHVTLESYMRDVGKEFNMTLESEVSDAVRIDNILVASVVGDLAEVVLNQAGSPTVFGATGRWNDSAYPREHYVSEPRWDMTKAELLGGLDALILAGKIREWTSVLSSTRFSEILDMYYSERGVGYERAYRACERRAMLAPIFRDFDFSEQISATAKLLLESGDYGKTVFPETIDSYSRIVSERFKKFAEEETASYNICERGGDNGNNLEIIAILDGTWRPDEIFSMISYLAELTDVSYYGSKLGIINGQTGRWMANVTSDVVEIFSSLGNTTEWPGRLRLSDSLNAVSRYYQNKTSPNCAAKKSRAFGHVVLVLAGTGRVRDEDANGARLATRTLKGSHPDVRIIYVASESSASHFQEFADNDLVFASANDIPSFVNAISEKLSNTPASIVNFYCDGNKVEIEDYVTPGIEKLYEVHGDFVRRARIVVKFRGNHYGDLAICAREGNFCKQITGSDEITFDVTDLCSIEPCDVRFLVSVNSTNNKCTEMDCRFPDQVRLDITTLWSSATRTSSTSLAILLGFLGLVPYVLYESA